MNTIVIYSSKYGCAADCANYLKSGLPGDVSLTDIDKINPETINMKNFNIVIFGSSIYIGSISKKMRAFCNKNIDLLSKKRVGIFLCCAFSAQTDEYLSKNFHPELLKSAVAVKSFGGEARVDKMKTFDKLIMKAATKGDNKDLKISYENIDSFIKEISL